MQLNCFVMARIYNKLRKTSACVHLSAELQVHCFPNDDLCCGEHIQVSKDMTADGLSVFISEADVQVSILVKCSHQRHNLKAFIQFNHLT